MCGIKKCWRYYTVTEMPWYRQTVVLRDVKNSKKGQRHWHESCRTNDVHAAGYNTAEYMDITSQKAVQQTECIFAKLLHFSVVGLMYIHTRYHCSAVARFLTVKYYVQLSLKNSGTRRRFWSTFSCRALCPCQLTLHTVTFIQTNYRAKRHLSLFSRLILY